jgi:hypothetical protein
VTNTGLSKIAQSTVSVSVATDARTYFKTLGSSESILPGGSLYIDGTVSYAGPTEILRADGVLVVDRFFE